METEMNIINAKYIRGEGQTVDEAIEATIDGVLMFVPLVRGNAQYDEIMRQVAAGTLTITPAS